MRTRQALCWGVVVWIGMTLSAAALAGGTSDRPGSITMGGPSASATFIDPSQLSASVGSSIGSSLVSAVVTYVTDNWAGWADFVATWFFHNVTAEAGAVGTAKDAYELADTAVEIAMQDAPAVKALPGQVDFAIELNDVQPGSTISDDQFTTIADNAIRLAAGNPYSPALVVTARRMVRERLDQLGIKVGN